MKKISFLLYTIASLILLSACQTEQQAAQKRITKLEASVEKGGDPGEVNTLIQNYLAYVTTHPDDTEASPRYLYRTASLQYRLNNFDGAKASLEKAIRDYYDNENTANSVLLLGSIYQEKLNSKMAGSVLYQSAAESFPSLNNEASIAAIKQANIPPVARRLEVIAKNMYQDTTGRIDLRLANDFITGCHVYALISPQGDQAPDFLYKAGETARTIQAFGKAIELYDWILDKYPNFSKAPQAMFLKGFTLDNDLSRIEDAREVYETFLAKFPQDDFADDAEFLLENLGKTDEEIINAFGKQQAEQ